MAGLLERYDAMQRRPFGTNTALSPENQNGIGGVAGSQYRRQEQAYGQALRLLSRAARRGDANSALRAIAVREDAMSKGYAPGGIRQKTQADAGILARVDALGRSAQDIGMANDVTRRRAQEDINGTVDVQVPGSADTQVPGTGQRPMAEEFQQGTVNPNATAGAGRGRPISDRYDQRATLLPATGAPQAVPLDNRRMSFSEAEREGRRRLTLEGAFGQSAKEKLEKQGERASSILERADSRLKRFGTIA